MSTGIIILAAGNSSRLGKPKQLLFYQGKTLLEIVTEAALQTSFKPIVIVLGAHADEVLRENRHAGVKYIINDNWQDGMASSIAFGVLKIVNEDPEIENVIIAVSDQVFINSGILEGLLAKKELSGKNIVACSYGQTTGTPVLFNKKYFGKLMALKGSKGAKQILEQHLADTETMAFALGHIDIDTETDYYNLINHK